MGAMLILTVTDFRTHAAFFSSDFSSTFSCFFGSHCENLHYVSTTRGLIVPEFTLFVTGGSAPHRRKSIPIQRPSSFVPYLMSFVLHDTAMSSIGGHMTRLIEHPEPFPLVADKTHVFRLVEQLIVAP